MISPVPLLLEVDVRTDNVTTDGSTAFATVVAGQVDPVSFEAEPESPSAKCAITPPTTPAATAIAAPAATNVPRPRPTCPLGSDAVTTLPPPSQDLLQRASGHRRRSPPALLLGPAEQDTADRGHDDQHYGQLYRLGMRIDDDVHAVDGRDRSRRKGDRRQNRQPLAGDGQLGVIAGAVEVNDAGEEFLFAVGHAVDPAEHVLQV